MLAELVLTTVLVMFASLIGVITVWRGVGDWLRKNTGYVTSFAAGVFLVVTMTLAQHALVESALILPVVAYMLAGVGLIYGLSNLTQFFHHHHDSGSEHEHTKPEAYRILLSDGFHNIGDGLLLAVSFQISVAAGIAAGIAVFFHELVQEISEFFVLKNSGLSTRRALLYNFGVSATILVGAVLGTVAINQAELLRLPLLGLTAGSFLVVIAHDLIPHSIREARARYDIYQHVHWFLLGVILMLAAKLLLPH